MPLVSADWKKITDWRGRGAPPRSLRRRVAVIGADDLDGLRRFLSDSSGGS
jgi:hypothetical protein